MSVPDYPLDQTLNFKFTSRAFSNGVPTSLTGANIVIYEDNSVTKITDGFILNTDFDGIVGLNNLNITGTTANGYENGKTYTAVLNSGGIDGTSVVGEVVQQFSIERNPGLRPTITGRTVDVTAGGAVGIDWGNVENQGTNVDLSSTTIDVVNTATDVTNPVTVGTINSNVITAASINTDAIDANAIADNAIDANSIAANALSGKGDWSLQTSLVDVSGNVDTIDTKIGTPTDFDTGADLASNLEDIAGSSFNPSQDALENISTIEGNTSSLVTRLGNPINIGGSGTNISANLVAMAGNSFTGTTDSLEAIRNRGDVAWITSDATAANQTNILNSLTDISGDVTGIKNTTDSFSFTVSNQVDANIQFINNTAIVGDGTSPKFGV